MTNTEQPVWQKKLPAATLIEALVAMIIVLVCFGIGTMIYLNVLNSTKSQQKLDATLLLNESALATKQQQRYHDATWQHGQYKIEQKILPSNRKEQVAILQLTAKNKAGKTLATRKEVILLPNDQTLLSSP